MSTDAAPHATPDQVRAAEKRAAAARAAVGENAEAERSAPPKGRRTAEAPDAT